MRFWSDGQYRSVQVYECLDRSLPGVHISLAAITANPIVFSLACVWPTDLTVKVDYDSQTHPSPPARLCAWMGCEIGLGLFWHGNKPYLIAHFINAQRNTGEIARVDQLSLRSHTHTHTHNDNNNFRSKPAGKPFRLLEMHFTAWQ